jgi:hypothetical protein
LKKKTEKNKPEDQKLTAEPEVGWNAKDVGNLCQGSGRIIVNEGEVNRHAEGHNRPSRQGDPYDRDLFAHKAGTGPKKVDAEIFPVGGVLSVSLRHGLVLLLFARQMINCKEKTKYSLSLC